ncbi:MAG: EAL domain-containing protein [Oscillospiraceae bacterium]|nr:EAL domain-containing protein [Oscillospiraceae bacterium]
MLSQKKVLIVEDNPLNRQMLRRILEPSYDILEAENGQAALEVLQQYGEGVSLILLDIMMPVMDGYTFMKKMKANPDYASIPVIVTTQRDSESDEVAALSSGATDFIAKPYRAQVILHRVASMINLRETAAMINLLQYDRLTGLFSKEFFYQRAHSILQSDSEERYDIICSDIENFKLVNDVFGVSTGDRLLCGIADLYRQKIRGHGICGRLDSDRFACLVRHQPDYPQELFSAFTEQVNQALKMQNITIKWGIYEVQGRLASVEQMCDRALLAANRIKGQYGKYFAKHDDELRNQLLHDQEMTAGMEEALEQKQFQIYLQPKYQIRDERLVGAEVLVRWNHPKWGMQSPSEFIPLFEKNGFITKLDQFVWDRACAMLRNWQDKGLPSVSVSVNVSRADIYNADIAHILLETVQKYGLEPSRLHLEITESAYTENPKQIIDTVRRLRRLGFYIEMDDFGQGYSSLNMLNELPIDVLKLDMKFIQNETAKPNSGGILQFIIDLARWMHLSVVAEGVETKEQLDRLSEIGCDYVQGYYFAKPMPCDAYELLLGEFQREKEKPGESPFQFLKELPVLLVADADEAYQKQISETFRGQYRVKSMASYEETLGYIETHRRIAAMIVSLSGPSLDGFALLRTIQQEKRFWNIPIVATAPPDAQTEWRALEAGAADFIGKPHLMQSLSKRLHRVISAAANEEKARMLQDAAYKDPLTGVLNRRGMEVKINALSQSDLPLAVYVFDLDDLKPCNDHYGHAKGDRMLEKFGAILRTHTREKDILARVGGDEFVAIMRQMPSEEVAKKKGEEICAAVRENGLQGGIMGTCSAGVAMVRSGDAIAQALEQADQALYWVKNREKGNCCLWQKDL